MIRVSNFDMNIFLVGSVLVLALLLYYPVSKIVWVFSVRRLQRKESRELSESELQGQLKRARIISAILVLLFSYLFNASLMGSFGYG